MLLNIADFNPRAKKRLASKEIKSKGEANITCSSEPSQVETIKKRKLQPDVTEVEKPPAQLQDAVKKVTIRTVGKSNTAQQANIQLGSKAGKTLTKSESSTPNLRTACNDLAFESAPNDLPVVKQRRRWNQGPKTSDTDGPDWASVSDCLLEEVKNVEKLFEEKLDMEMRTDNTDKVFSGLVIKDYRGIHPYLVSLLTEKMRLQYFTKVQADTLPLVLAGKDVLIKTQTGSGKSLALLLPLVHQLQAVQPPLTRTSGVQALVICPTHELAEQTHQLLQQLLHPFVRIVSGQLVGGVKRKSQKAALRRGLNILVATPRRLLDHLEMSSRLDIGSSLRMLIIDEADRLTEMGYEKDVRKIVEAACSGGRRPQTLLCSATLSDGAERLAGLALNQPSKVFEDDALPASVQHHVLAAPTKMGLRALLAVIRALVTGGHKAAVFLPTQSSVDFHYSLLSTLLSDSVPLCRLHGNLSHADRMRAFREFASSSGSGLLVTTDVSARGLDLSHLSWVIQGPGEPDTYCHRAGRTARLGRPGRCLLMLDNGEAGRYLRLLKSSPCGRAIKFAPMPFQQLLDRYSPENFHQLATLVTGDPELKALAEDAFISSVRARSTFGGELKNVLQMPHLGRLAGSFCLSDPPGVIAANCRSRKNKGTGQSEQFLKKRHWGKSSDSQRNAEKSVNKSKKPQSADSSIAAAASTHAFKARTSRVQGGRRVVVDRMSEFASGI